MSTLADRTISALRGNLDGLAAKVRGLDDEDLLRKSGAAEWNVAQVLSHLGSAAEIGLAGLERALAGEDAPDQDFNLSAWDRWNAKTPREKAAGYLLAAERRQAAYEDLDEATRRDLRIQLSFLPFPADLALITGMGLNEAAMHSWDVRVAFDPAAALTTDEADVLLEQFAGPLGFMVGFLGKAANLDGAEVALRVETTHPERVVGLVIGDAVSIGEAPDAADGVLTGPTEAFLRLLLGRLREDSAPPQVAVSGGAVTLDQLRQVFPGI